MEITTENIEISKIKLDELNCRASSSNVPLKPREIIELYTLSPLSYPLIRRAPDANASGFNVLNPFSE